MKRPDDIKPMADYIALAGETQGQADGRQAIHYSQQSLTKTKPGAHFETIALTPFIDFIEGLTDQNIDIMLEVKDKNRSAEKLQLYLNQDFDIAEKLWQKYDYAVQAKRVDLYQQGKHILADRNAEDITTFISILEEAELAKGNPESEVIAAKQLFSRFKNRATSKEHAKFQKTLLAYQEDKKR